MSVDGSCQKRQDVQRFMPTQLFCAIFLCIVVWTDNGSKLLLVIVVVEHQNLSL